MIIACHSNLYRGTGQTVGIAALALVLAHYSCRTVLIVDLQESLSECQKSHRNELALYLLEKGIDKELDELSFENLLILCQNRILTKDNIRNYTYPVGTSGSIDMCHLLGKKMNSDDYQRPMSQILQIAVEAYDVVLIDFGDSCSDEVNRKLSAVRHTKLSFVHQDKFCIETSANRETYFVVGRSVTGGPSGIKNITQKYKRNCLGHLPNDSTLLHQLNSGGLEKHFKRLLYQKKDKGRPEYLKACISLVERLNHIALSTRKES